jgi:hypothetical protein
MIEASVSNWCGVRPAAAGERGPASTESSRANCTPTSRSAAASAGVSSAKK